MNRPGVDDSDSSPPGPGDDVPDQLTIYSTQWCGYCHRLMKQLDREGVGYQVVDIEDGPSAAPWVMSVSAGNQPAPTVVFPDGSPLTTRSLHQVVKRLAG